MEGEGYYFKISIFALSNTTLENEALIVDSCD